jgi:hypothetical protein
VFSAISAALTLLDGLYAVELSEWTPLPNPSHPRPSPHRHPRARTHPSRPCPPRAVSNTRSGSPVATAYVNTNQLDRSANLAAQQTVRSDRQKAYLDFLAACSDYLGQVGVLKGLLAAHSTDREALKSTINAAASQGGKALNNSLGVLLAGSHQMADIVPKFATVVGDFSGRHLNPFILRYLTPGGAGENDDAGMLRDEAAMSGAIDTLVDQAGTVYTEVLDQARTDLGFG